METKNSDEQKPCLNNESDSKTEQNGTLITEKSKKQGCKGIHLFLINYALLLLFYMAQNIYNVGVIRTIERKFGLRSAQSGLIMSSNDVSHIMVVIFVGYFGKKAHKPRFLSLSLLLVSLAGYMMALPQLIFKDSPPLQIPPTIEPFSGYKALNGGYESFDSVSVLTNHSRHDFNPLESERMLCDNNNENEECSELEVAKETGNMVAYGILLAAQFIAGLGGCGITTLGFSYVDENSPSHKSPFYIGILSAIFGLAPVLGLGLSALCLKLPVNLQSDPEGNPGDLTWIGAWWLGYVITATCIICCCIPMWFFPKHMIQKVDKSDILMKKEDEKNVNVKNELKEFPQSLLSLMKNAPYMVQVLMTVLLMYTFVGLYSNLPRYVEIHFRMPAYISSFIAISGAVAGIIGALIGGYIMKRFKLGVHGAVKILICSFVALVIGLLTNTLLGCEKLDFAGEWSSDDHIGVVVPCNANCSCPTNKYSYKPVCGDDGLTYFSGCHAGCRDFNNGSFVDCSCMPSNSTNGYLSARPGICASTCKLLIPYMVVYFIFSLLGSVCRAPGTIITFRIVGDEQRTFALALTSFAINLLAFIPAPLLFGALIDSTCILWQETCNGTGSCLLFDSKKFRLVTHGSAFVFQCLGLVCAIVIFFLIRKKTFVHDQQDIEIHVTDEISGEKVKDIIKKEEPV